MKTGPFTQFEWPLAPNPGLIWGKGGMGLAWRVKKIQIENCCISISRIFRQEGRVLEYKCTHSHPKTQKLLWIPIESNTSHSPIIDPRMFNIFFALNLQYFARFAPSTFEIMCMDLPHPSLSIFNNKKGAETG
jgi:hypothetical protein